MRTARAARKAATAELGSHTQDADALAAAELIIGELLSNAARHADGHVCLELHVRDGNATISVHDTSQAFTLDVHPPADEFSESGRGLFIISELADRITVKPVAGIGKVVSVTLRVPVQTGGMEQPCDRVWLRHEEGVCMRPRIARYHPGVSNQPGF